MKIFATALFLASSVFSASAFSAVSPMKVDPAKNMGDGPDPVDKSLKGIDAEGSYDPVAGENAALTRNNNDEVWVQQVSLLDIFDTRCIYQFVLSSLNIRIPKPNFSFPTVPTQLNATHSYLFSEHDLVATESRPL
jgi:hypothetical protein